MRVALAAEDEVHGKVGGCRRVETLDGRIHRVRHVMQADAGRAEGPLQFAPAGRHEDGVHDLRPPCDPRPVLRNEQRVVVAVDDDGRGPAAAQFGERVVRDDVAVPGDHEIRLDGFGHLEQAPVRAAATDRAQPQRRLEGGHVAVAEGMDVVAGLDEPELQLLRPAHARGAVPAQLLVRDVQDAHPATIPRSLSDGSTIAPSCGTGSRDGERSQGGVDAGVAGGSGVLPRGTLRPHPQRGGRAHERSGAARGARRGRRPLPDRHGPHPCGPLRGRGGAYPHYRQLRRRLRARRPRSRRGARHRGQQHPGGVDGLHRGHRHGPAPGRRAAHRRGGAARARAGRGRGGDRPT